MKKDIDQLEKMQKRCLRLCSTEISLLTLAERRRQIDMVKTFKFLNGKYKTASSTFFELPPPPHREGLRGHSHKIFKKDAKTEVAKQFFGNGVVKGTGHDFWWLGKPINHFQKQGNIHIFQNK